MILAQRDQGHVVVDDIVNLSVGGGDLGRRRGHPQGVDAGVETGAAIAEAVGGTSRVQDNQVKLVQGLASKPSRYRRSRSPW